MQMINKLIDNFKNDIIIIFDIHINIYILIIFYIIIK